MRGSIRSVRWLLALTSTCAPSLWAQDMEPRRWTHMPVGTDILAVSYLSTSGDLSFDPVLQIQDAQVDLSTTVLSYTRYFALGERTARIDLVLPAQSGEWEGLVNGVSTSVSRDGLADPAVRFSVNLAGAPALSGPEFAAYRKEHRTATSVGAALELRMPVGEYQEDKLINLGQNRVVLASQLGVLHTREDWSFELTGTLFLYEDNDEFFNGNELEQDPLYAAQAHVVRFFAQGWWVALGAAYAWAGESTVNGVSKDDEKSTLVYGGSFGCLLNASQSLRIAYARTDTLVDVGSDTDSVFVGWSMRL